MFCLLFKAKPDAKLSKQVVQPQMGEGMGKQKRSRFCYISVCGKFLLSLSDSKDLGSVGAAGRGSAGGVLCMSPVSLQRLVVCLEESIYIHNIKDMKLLKTILDTPPNTTGEHGRIV